MDKSCDRTEIQVVSSVTRFVQAVTKMCVTTFNLTTEKYLVKWQHIKFMKYSLINKEVDAFEKISNNFYCI